MFVRRRTTLVVSVLLIAVVAVGSLGYGLGRFVTPPEQITTTTTSTQVSTSLVTVTEMKTTTSTVTRTLPKTLPPPAGSTAVIRSFLLLNARVLATLSIDKPVYSQGEIVHTKATLTNITPNDLTLTLESEGVRIENSARQKVWTYPEWEMVNAIAPTPEYDLHLSSGETATIDHMTASWNMTGLHIIATPGDVYYDDHPVPAGQYTLVWPGRIESKSDRQYDQIYEQIPFTITSKK